MKPTQYEQELAKLHETYQKALAADIQRLKIAIAGASESSIIGVGSGGSYTAASLLCSLHEAYTGRVSRPSTPLEIICNPTLSAVSPVFLISAEGKNPDIVEALQRARMHSARPLHIITNRQDSPLIACANRLTDINIHIFELKEKDGYLATNSLLLDAVLIARAYCELDNEFENIPASIEELRLRSQTIAEWLSDAAPFVDQAVTRGAVIITFSPLMRAVAADLESKLAESALLHCQLTDLRSFAHGRHLWLAERPNGCTILAVIEPTLSSLWESMRSKLPPEIPAISMLFDGATPRDLLAGLVAQMRLLSAIAQRLGKDPGNPAVPQFGRDLHYMDISALIPAPLEPSGSGERSKYEVLGARWPSLPRRGSMQRALEGFQLALEQQEFRAIVFDYDGTLCGSHRNDNPPPPQSIVDHLRTLIDGGIFVGIASGRGGSIQEELQKSFPAELWPKIQLGLYNAGHISTLADPIPENRPTSEFLSHAARIIGRLKTLGVPIEQIRTTHPFQVSVRFREGVHAENNWFVIADALRQAGLDLSKVVRSKYSVDILGDGVNKSHLVAHMIQNFKVDPYEVLTMGDQGAWPGNDSSLLEHRFSLSVDVPSRRMDRGWKLAPAHKRDVDATLWYLDRIHVIGGGKFKLRPSIST